MFVVYFFPILTIGDLLLFVILGFFGIHVYGKLILSIPVLISLDLIVSNVYIARKKNKDSISFISTKSSIFIWLSLIIYFVLVGKVIIPILIFTVGVTIFIFLFALKNGFFLENTKISLYDYSLYYDEYLPLQVFIISIFCILAHILFYFVFSEIYEPLLFAAISILLLIPNILIILLRNQNIKNSLALVLTPLIISLCGYTYQLEMFSDKRRYGHYEFNPAFYKNIEKDDILFFAIGLAILLLPQIISNVINMVRERSFMLD